ncbi:alpha/beta hydrolase [Nocardia fusca]|jgi:pimeloyl-ACP methyl ester carboxylesterase|uniref:Alpha/beta hydrolase n=1 Tax=Nocardia fusca TaxID=941183 RepID=A0ABV3FB87_9NOCA
MESRRIAVGDRDWTVRVDGPVTQHSVLLLPDSGDPPDVYDRVCTRLHSSDLRTIVFETAEGLDTAGVYAALDEIGVPWVNVAGRGTGASVAWEVCAKGFGRFVSLVVADRGHPAVPDEDGGVLDAGCPAVELPTTVLVTKRLPRPVADSSGRHVYGEFRVVGVDVDNIATEADQQFATEIVLRTSMW